MIDRTRLLNDLKSATKALIGDLRTRTDDVPEVGDPVREQYTAARTAGRTDRSFQEWREDLLAQVAVGWVLGTVFVRFCEDNGLFPTPLLSGPSERRRVAGDHRTAWLAKHPAAGDRQWLLEVFGRYQTIPATAGVFGSHNPLWQFGPTDPGARSLVELWWALDPESGDLRHDFTDVEWDTRFLGDLYQDLSEHAKKTYALLQTPDFVEEFILERTLEPAIRTFGLATVRMIDPTCGSGHFLLGSFHRLLRQWQEREPGTPIRDLVQRALDGVHGVDLNPFAVAIARFRLLVAALKASGVTRLEDAPDFRIHVATGDSLLHGRRAGELFGPTEGFGPLMKHRYPSEDEVEANRLLEGGTYHAVVGNPPYITVKEPALREAYRALYETAYRQYSLGVPFTERFFDLAMSGGRGQEAGFVGMITANSFMKREFGKKLVEEYLVRKDLTHVIDTSGAYIPGHGTPTVILFGRNQRPTSSQVRALLGIRGEPRRPTDPAAGEVWSSILSMVEGDEQENAFLSAEDASRDRFAVHPWSLQGGGAPELFSAVVKHESRVLGKVAALIGRTCHTGGDEAYLAPRGTGRRFGVPADRVVPLIEGGVIRDYRIADETEALFPYSEDLKASLTPELLRRLWPQRGRLRERREPGGTHEEIGLTWYEWSRWHPERFSIPLGIAFAFVATHNHFVLDRGGKVFKQTAPVIKLPEDATEDDHLRLLGLLNSSTACFWMKQVFQKKTQMGGGGGSAKTPFSHQYEHDSTKLQQFPIPSRTPLLLARKLDDLVQELERYLPARLLDREPPSRKGLHEARGRVKSLRARMVAVHEELDWECYHLYGLTDRTLTLAPDEVPQIQRGERAFEVALARAVAEDRTSSTWFDYHGSTPITDLPDHWPDEYRSIVEARLELIRSDRKIRLLERPEYKRRWNWESWEEMERDALRNWLLDHVEKLSLWKEPELQTVARVADALAQDPAAMEAARLLDGHTDVDLTALLKDLLLDEAVPFAAPLRFSEAGLRKYREWEHTWDLQRTEDALDARAALPAEHPDHLTAAALAEAKKEAGVDKMAVPPKYVTKDFVSTTVWRQRGKLDVPKERFILYPGTRLGADDSAVLGWAGWDHLERARALAGQYQHRKDAGADSGELTALLAGLQELVPWLLQWYNDLDPTWGQRMGDFFRTFVEGEARGMGLTPQHLRTWTPTGAAARA